MLQLQRKTPVPFAKFAFIAFASIATAIAQTVSPFIGGAWCGAVTASTATVSIRLNSAGQRTRLAVSTNPSLGAPIFSAAINSNVNAGNAVKLAIQGLQPDTDYYFAIEIAGSIRIEPESRGRFRTFPLGRASFKIAFSGDSDFRLANQSAFDAITAERPLLFIHLGDLHYIDTNSTNTEDYRRNYDAC